MNKKELFDWIKLHHPDMNETVMTKLLNRAMDDFCESTEILKEILTIEGGSVANQRYYSISDLVLKIKEMRINEIPISRIMDTGMMDSTILSSSTNTDTGADGSGTDGTEEGTTPYDSLGTAAYFNNDVTSWGGAGGIHNAAKYISFPNTMFAECDNQAQMTISIWVKFDNSNYNDVGYIFNNMGEDPSNGRCSIHLRANGPFSGLDYSHTPIGSICADFAPKNTANQYDIHNGNNANKYRVGVAKDGFSFKDGSPGQSVKNKWHLITMTFDGRPYNDGGGLRLYIDNTLQSNKHSSFLSMNNYNESPYYAGAGSPQNWRDGDRADAYGAVKPHLSGSGNYYYHSDAFNMTYAHSQNVQLGCFKYTDGVIAAANQPNSSITGSMLSTGFGDHVPGEIVFPFSGYMRNLIIAQSVASEDSIENLYNQGPNAAWGNVGGILSNTQHFYKLETNANDEAEADGATINGTVQNGLTFVETEMLSSEELGGGSI